LQESITSGVRTCPAAARNSESAEMGQTYHKFGAVAD